MISKLELKIQRIRTISENAELTECVTLKEWPSVEDITSLRKWGFCAEVEEIVKTYYGIDPKNDTTKPVPTQTT